MLKFTIQRAVIDKNVLTSNRMCKKTTMTKLCSTLRYKGMTFSQLTNITKSYCKKYINTNLDSGKHFL